MTDYQLIARDRTINGWYDGNEPAASDGYGGWQTTQRPQKPSLTIWTGRGSFQISLPMLLTAAGASVEDQIHDLQVLASANSVASGPDLVRLAGPLLTPVVPTHAGEDWVIQDLSWGDRLRDKGLTIVRQQVTITLLEHTTDELLAASTLESRQGGRPVVQHYTVKRGDTLHSIAAKELGDPKRWLDIAAANGLRSSGQLRVGMQLKLP